MRMKRLTRSAQHATRIVPRDALYQSPNDFRIAAAVPARLFGTLMTWGVAYSSLPLQNE